MHKTYVPYFLNAIQIRFIKMTLDFSTTYPTLGWLNASHLCYKQNLFYPSFELNGLFRNACLKHRKWKMEEKNPINFLIILKSGLYVIIC